MTIFQKWMLKRIAKQAVIQGPAHENNIITMYKIIREAIQDEFTEDSPLGQDHYTWEQFEKAQLFPAIENADNPDAFDDILMAAVAKARRDIIDGVRNNAHASIDEQIDAAIAEARLDIAQTDK